jgi:hypothetical protein
MQKQNKKNYLLQIPESLHNKLKEKSVAVGLSMRHIVQQSLEKELNRQNRQEKQEGTNISKKDRGYILNLLSELEEAIPKIEEDVLKIKVTEDGWIKSPGEGEVLPCPFCGEIPFVPPKEDGRETYQISCGNYRCAMHKEGAERDDGFDNYGAAFTPNTTRRSDCINIWNTRADKNGCETGGIK